MLFPNDHVRLLTELLRPAGVELARRWLAALLVVDEGEREAMVAAVEKRVVELYGIGRDYGGGSDSGVASGVGEITVVHSPRQVGGFVERVEVTYGAGAKGTGKAASGARAPQVRVKAKAQRRKA